MTSKHWESYMIVLPPGEDADQLQEFLKAQLGFDESGDWCEMSRPDAARVSWGPCDPPVQLPPRRFNPDVCA